jgi:hypothetical protein
MKSIPARKALLPARPYQQVTGQIAAWLQDFYLYWEAPLRLFAIWRVGLLLLPFVAALMLEPNKRNATSPYIIPNFYTGTADFWYDRLLAAWGRWDGEWYLQIINHGYTPAESTPAFFPIYPFLVKFFGGFFLNEYLLSGLVVSTVASVITFMLLYQLTLRDFHDKALARTTVLMLAVFPTAFFMGALYTEAVFMALALAAFYCVRHLQQPYKWWLAGFFVALATLTRNVGILLVASMLWEWWRQNRQTGRFFRFQPGSFGKLAGLLVLPGLALSGWIGTLWLVLGDPMLPLKAQSSSAWKRQSAPPWESVWQGFTGLFEKFTEANFINFWYFGWWLVLVGAGAWLVWKRRYPVSYFIFLVLAFLPGLCAPRADQPLFALPRYLLVLFPAFQIMALLIPKAYHIRKAYLLFSLFCFLYLTIHFVQWGWVA